MARVLLPLLLVLPLLSACTKVYPVNPNPLAMSTLPLAAEGFEPVQRVSTRQCMQWIVVVPLRAKTERLYDDLVAEAARVGGSAVVGMEVRVTDVMVVPFYFRACYEASGLAVKRRVVATPAPEPAPAKSKKKK